MWHHGIKKICNWIWSIYYFAYIQIDQKIVSRIYQHMLSFLIWFNMYIISPRKGKSGNQPRISRWSISQAPDVPRQTIHEIRQIPDAWIESSGDAHMYSGKTVETQSAPSGGGKIPVNISHTWLKQLAKDISVSIYIYLQNNCQPIKILGNWLYF